MTKKLPMRDGESQENIGSDSLAEAPQKGIPVIQPPIDAWRFCVDAVRYGYKDALEMRKDEEGYDSSTEVYEDVGSPDPEDAKRAEERQVIERLIIQLRKPSGMIEVSKEDTLVIIKLWVDRINRKENLAIKYPEAMGNDLVSWGFIMAQDDLGNNTSISFGIDGAGELVWSNKLTGQFCDLIIYKNGRSRIKWGTRQVAHVNKGSEQVGGPSALASPFIPVDPESENLPDNTSSAADEPSLPLSPFTPVDPRDEEILDGLPTASEGGSYPGGKYTAPGKGGRPQSPARQETSEMKVADADHQLFGASGEGGFEPTPVSDVPQISPLLESDAIPTPTPPVPPTPVPPAPTPAPPAPTPEEPEETSDVFQDLRDELALELDLEDEEDSPELDPIEETEPQPEPEPAPAPAPPPPQPEPEPEPELEPKTEPKPELQEVELKKDKYIINIDKEPENAKSEYEEVLALFRRLIAVDITTLVAAEGAHQLVDNPPTFSQIVKKPNLLLNWAFCLTRIKDDSSEFTIDTAKGSKQNPFAMLEIRNDDRTEYYQITVLSQRRQIAVEYLMYDFRFTPDEDEEDDIGIDKVPLNGIMGRLLGRHKKE